MGSPPPYLLCFGPEHIFQVSGKALAQPLLCPVAGPDGEPKPGVGNFVAEAGPAEMAAACQGALGEEDDVWAGHSQTRKVGGDDKDVQPGEGVCSQHRMCCREAGRDQPQKGLLAGILEAQRGKDSVRNDLLSGGSSILEAAGIFHVTAGTNTPEVGLGRWDGSL